MINKEIKGDLIALAIICPSLAYLEIKTYQQNKIVLSNILFILVNTTRAAFLTVVTYTILYI